MFFTFLINIFVYLFNNICLLLSKLCFTKTFYSPTQQTGILELVFRSNIRLYDILLFH